MCANYLARYSSGKFRKFNNLNDVYNAWLNDKDLWLIYDINNPGKVIKILDQTDQLYEAEKKRYRQLCPEWKNSSHVFVEYNQHKYFDPTLQIQYSEHMPYKKQMKILDQCDNYINNVYTVDQFHNYIKTS